MEREKAEKKRLFVLIGGIGGGGGSSLVEELDQGFTQDGQTAGHRLLRTGECGTKIINPLGGCQGWERKVKSREKVTYVE